MRFVTYLILFGCFSCGVQPKLLFFPKKLEKNYSFALQDSTDQELFLKGKNGGTTNALFYHRFPGRPFVLYFHGNAGALDSWQQVTKDFFSRRLNVLIIDYKGFGKSDGKITQKGIYEDANMAFEFLRSKGIEAKDVLLYGRSIGTGVAAHLASLQPLCRAVLLESPYSSVSRLATEKMPFLVPCLYLNFRFNPIRDLKGYTNPVWIIHTTKDEIIPVSHSDRIHKRFTRREQACTYVRIEEESHNSVTKSKMYQESLDAFLSSLGI